MDKEHRPDSPAWVSEPGTKPYAIPQDVVEHRAGDIKDGLLWLPQTYEPLPPARTSYQGEHADAWREAWERAKKQCVEAAVVMAVDRPDKSLPPDGAVWLVRRECGLCKVVTRTRCDTCHGAGHIHELVRCDVSVQTWDSTFIAKHHSISDFIEAVFNLTDIAGLHFVRPERTCDKCYSGAVRVGGKAVMPSGKRPHEVCDKCHGMGTLPEETYDVWASKEARWDKKRNYGGATTWP